VGPYIGHLISVLVMLAGLVGVYVKIQNDLTAIKTRLQIDDKGAADRAELDRSRARDAAEIFCRDSCPRAGIGGTNPRIQQYHGEIAP